MFREKEQPDHLHFFRNMFPEDFLRVLVRSHGIVGNSSVAIRECSYLGVPAVNIGSRQQGRERGRNVIDAGYDRRAITEAIQEQLAHGRYPSDSLYGDGLSGTRIADVLATAPLTVQKRLVFTQPV